MAVENLWLPDLFIKEFMDVGQAPLGLWLMSTVKVTSDTINHGGVVSICHLASSVSPWMNTTPRSLQFFHLNRWPSGTVPASM